MIEDFGHPAAVDGRLVLSGTAAALCRWIDAKIRNAAVADGATDCVFPASITRAILTRANYFESFPDGATAIGGPAPADLFLSPAVCYHAYALLAGRTVDRVALTAAQTCFREADRAIGSPSDPTRLWEFTMREVIFIGAADWVASRRQLWIARAQSLVTELRLTGAIDPATDSFFGDISRGQRLLQQLKHLKDELRLPIEGRSVAVASFNLHETFFGKRFELTLADATTAHSACAAFGLERWALAILAQRGEAGAQDVLKEMP